jgi:hypothetical protein
MTPTPPNLFPGFPPGAVVTAEQMNAILQTLGHDEHNIETIGQGWAIANDAYLRHAIAGDYPDQTSRDNAINSIGDGHLKDHIHLGAEVLARIFHQAETGNEQLRNNQDAQDQLRSDILNFAASLPVPGLGPTIHFGEIITWFNQHDQQNVTEWANQHLDPDQKQRQAKDNNEIMIDHATDATFQILYDQGFWNSWPPDKQPPPGAFIPGTTQFDTTSDAYSHWKEQVSGMWDTIKAAAKDAYGI